MALLGLTVFGLACERTDNAIIDANGAVPLLTAVVVSPSSINTDSINVGPTRQPEDTLHLIVAIFAQASVPAGTQHIASVAFSVSQEGSSTPLALGELADDGSAPDQSKGDGTYSGWATFQIERVEIGAYRVEVTAEAENGFRSGTLITPLQIIRGNHPPAISDLQAPDTVNTSVVSQFLITVTALDPDGLADIKSVTRTTPSGLVFTLNDQGVNGDVRAGDGTFSETVAVKDPSPPPGDYLFKFQAFDRSNEGSNVIIHRVTVTQ